MTNYTKPMVTIELEEYTELLNLKKEPEEALHVFKRYVAEHLNYLVHGKYNNQVSFVPNKVAPDELYSIILKIPSLHIGARSSGKEEYKANDIDITWESDKIK